MLCGFAATLLVGLAALFVARRLAGGLVQPLGGPATVILAAGLIVTVAVIRWSLPRRAARHLALFAVPGGAACALLAAITLPGTAPWSISLAWFAFVAAECATWVLAWQRPGQMPRRAAPPAVRGELEEIEEAVAPALVQQLTRQRAEGGGETLHAIVRVACTGGDRLAIAHLAFCPPLAAAPRLNAHSLDETGGEVRVTAAHTYGARIEVRLSEPAVEGQSVLVEVIGSA